MKHTKNNRVEGSRHLLLALARLFKHKKNGERRRCCLHSSYSSLKESGLKSVATGCERENEDLKKWSWAVQKIKGDRFVRYMSLLQLDNFWVVHICWSLNKLEVATNKKPPLCLQVFGINSSDPLGHICWLLCLEEICLFLVWIKSHLEVKITTSTLKYIFYTTIFKQIR